MFLNRKQCNRLGALLLGVWLFALLAAVANACVPGDPSTPHPTSHVSLAEHYPEGLAPSDCAQFCNDATPLFPKFQLVQDQPAGQHLLVSMPVVSSPSDLSNRVATTLFAHPPRDVSVLQRSHRLAL
jgi:hypothetical protein